MVVRVTTEVLPQVFAPFRLLEFSSGLMRVLSGPCLTGDVGFGHRPSSSVACPRTKNTIRHIIFPFVKVSVGLVLPQSAVAEAVEREKVTFSCVVFKVEPSTGK